MPRNDIRAEETARIALRLIHESVVERGFPPSQREIADACGWSSPSNANNLIRLLEARGLVRVATGVSRGLQITEAGMVAMTETV